MTEIEIKKALKIPLTEQDELKCRIQEIIDNIDLKECIKSWHNEDKYKGVFIPLHPSTFL